MKYEFAGFRFDPDRGLDRGGRRIHLPRKQHRLLAELLVEQGKVLSKGEIVDRVWGGGAVSDDSIFRAVHHLRQALAHDGIDPVATVHGAGFRIAVPIGVADDSPDSALRAISRSSSASAVESLVVAFEFRGRRSPEDLAVAIEAARRATALDPSYVLAWTTLAELHQVEGIRWYQPPRAAFAAAREAARRAIEADPRSPAAIAVEGSTRALLDLDLAGGLEHLDRAIANDPSYAAARVFRSFVFLALGRADLAESDARAAIDVNPLSTQARELLCMSLLTGGRGRAALEEIRSFAAQAPTIDSVLCSWAVVAAVNGEADEAIAAGRRAMEISPSTTQMHLGLLFGLIADGQEREARELLATIRAADIPAPPALLAPALLQLGDAEGATALLDASREARCLHFLLSESDPRLVDLVVDESRAGTWAELREARRSARERRRLS